jgi:Tfp pilus assembly protein PilN
MRTFLVLAALTCTTLLVVACGDTKVDRDQFVQKSQDNIQALRDDLSRLRERIATGDASDEAKQQADQLEQRINDAQDKLDEIRTAHADEWQKLKANLDDALAEATNIISNVRDDLGID